MVKGTLNNLPRVRIDTPCSRKIQEANPQLDIDDSCSNWGIPDPAQGGSDGQFKPAGTFRPANPYEISAAILKAEAEGKTIRAIGSGWSFSDVSIPQTASIDQSRSPFGYVIDTRYIASSLQLTLPQILAPGQVVSEYFFTEAGITIEDLNVLLDHQQPRVALATLGGSAGQTLAGVMSTGTHGGDWDRPPIADSVCAIYIVGMHGEHYWIEPSSGITDAKKLNSIYPCVDVIYDDETFYAALVSMGAMGIIYAVVLKVVPQYSLLDWNVTKKWEDTRNVAMNHRDMLLSGQWTGMSKYVADFLHPDSQWPEDAFKGRFLSVVINPVREDDGTHLCWVTNRYQLEAEMERLGPTPSVPAFSDLLSAYQNSPDHNLGATLADFLFAISAKAAPANVFEQANQFIAYCKSHGFFWGVREIITNILSFSFPEAPVSASPLMLSIAQEGKSSVEYDQMNIYPQIDIGYKVMAGGASVTFGATVPPMAIVSMEAFFPFNAAINYISALLDYLDSETAANRFPAGYVSLRVCGQTAALLGQEKISNTLAGFAELLGNTQLEHELIGAVEVAMLANGDTIAMIKNAEDLALSKQGSLHWGQSNGSLDATRIKEFFSPSDLASWKKIQSKLGGRTFKNLFMERCGLV